MWGLTRRTNGCVFACLSILGAAGVTGLAAGFQARPALAPAGEAGHLVACFRDAEALAA